VKAKRIVPPGHSLFRLAGPWCGIRPWLAMTLRNVAMFQDERGVNFRDVCSRVLIFFRYDSGTSLHSLWFEIIFV
jgi:hypothetical protein